MAQVGIFGRPTLVNNIETLYWVPAILEKGAAWFAAQGKNGAKGLRSYSVSGRVKNPGVVLTAAGSTCQDLIELCGGMADGHHFKGYLPGGASGGILPAYMADIPLDFGQLEKHGCFVGSHAVVILSDKDDMKAVALNLMRFFEDESCGQCTPCRNGTEKAVKLMRGGNWDAELLADLGQVMARRLHLRPGPGRAQPGTLAVQVLSRRTCGDRACPRPCRPCRSTTSACASPNGALRRAPRPASMCTRWTTWWCPWRAAAEDRFPGGRGKLCRPEAGRLLFAQGWRASQCHQRQ